MILNKLERKAKKTLMIFLSPYITFAFIIFFLVGGLFMGVEELWEEFTSDNGIEEISSSSKGMVWPLPGFSNISSYFGNRLHPIKKETSFHDGIDIPAPQDTIVISPTNGVIAKTYNSYSLGNTVEIESGEYKFVFHHLNFISVNQGDIINKGQKVGGVGTTGTLSTGNHLHFTVYRNNIKINPLEIVDFNNIYKDEIANDNTGEENEIVDIEGS